MKFALLAFLSVSLLSVSFLANASSFKVLKAQGKRAIVEFDDMNPEKSATYEVSGSGSTETSGGSIDAGSRKYSVDGTATFSSINNKSKTGTVETDGGTTTTLTLSPAFGINFGTYELGPIFSYLSRTISVGSNTLTTFGIGGFFEYNFTPNHTGEKMIPCAHIDVQYLSQSTGSSGTTTTLSGYLLDLGGKIKYFMFSDTLALTGSIFYTYTSLSQSAPTVTYTYSGFALAGGIAKYF